jgi:2-dehydro-3-deoxyphosphooctonate aldolase (KDO 8-P synthase)
VLESEDAALRIADTLTTLTAARGIPFIFKCSYDKANRTSFAGYRGPGLARGLEIVSRIKEKLGIPILLDVHRPEDAGALAGIADIVQIPAFLCRQTDLLLAAAETGLVVNIKKGQFMSPEDMASAAGKVRAGGNERVLLTERGVSFGYHNLIADMRSIPIMQKIAPVVFDATHSVQYPGGQGDRSGGDRSFVRPLARAAIAAGADLLFMEVHPRPDEALSDAASVFPLAEMDAFLREIKELAALVRSFPDNGVAPSAQDAQREGVCRRLHPPSCWLRMFSKPRPPPFANTRSVWMDHFQTRYICLLIVQGGSLCRVWVSRGTSRARSRPPFRVRGLRLCFCIRPRARTGIWAFSRAETR